MSKETIAARNRKNAQKSTGPKTARGKATVAGNARQHGVTAGPDPEIVTTWLAVILNEPEITPEALMPKDERGFRALSLAQAEARLITSQKALNEHEADLPAVLRWGIFFSAEDIVEGLRSGKIPPRDLSLTRRQVNRLLLDKKAEYQALKQRTRLLKRYLGEARSQKRKALSAWLNVIGNHELNV